ncbi:MAG TPA: Gfo/Idh/MocA family oxidoreductase [Gemmatimonadaceae bacterium]|nr:Gfo/Idh/MocA family oxidoreductase [Gemmatimonadaceae bacterium]
MSKKSLTRRDFVADSTKLALGAMIATPGFPMIVPRHVLGRGFVAPSDTVNFAVAGFGGMGSGNAEKLVANGCNLVAVCDVDMAFSDRNVTNKETNREGAARPEGVQLREQFNKTAKYADFREMLDKRRDIDGVVIATPDHNHAVIAKAAMQAGKSVYVQKPLTYSVYEARALARLARENPKLATQMGNQGHSGEGTRQIVEWIRAGVIGPVHEVHVWTNRPLGYWPQGIPRPAPPTAEQQQAAASHGTSWGQRRINETLAAAMGTYPIPEGLNWDLYLGPCNEPIAYHPVYHPFNWRGWVDFGMGALGDMGAHLIDQAFWALDLQYPVSLEATSTPWGGPSRKPATYPLATSVHYQFPARGKQPPVKMSWTDGGLYPTRPDILPDDYVLSAEGGGILIGEKGILIHETYGNNPRVWPDACMQAALAVPKSLPRIDVTHEMDWANAIKGHGRTSSPFEYASLLTETMLLGVVALRTGQGKKIIYDGAAMTVTNAPEANAFLTREYRSGWSV